MPGFELIGKEEHEELNDLMTNSGILFRHGFDALRNNIYKVKEFENNFAEFMQVKNALAVTSGTSALHVALKAFGIGAGDEVITQAFTFVATVEAIVESGAKPVICDIDETLNLDSSYLDKYVNTNTKAIIVVHMLGTPCNMNGVLKFAKKHNLKVIEDTAWGCGGKFNEQYLGTLGDAGTYSFDFAKTITTGEGGMVIIKDELAFERAKAYHDHGHENNPSLPRWEDSRSSSGFNYRMSELQGAIGIAQLKKLNFIVDSQRSNASKIKNILIQKKYKIRDVPEHSFETCDAVVFFAENKQKAISIRNKLLKCNISTKILPEAMSWHFAESWDHIDELKNDSKMPNLEISRNILERAVALPVFVKMKDDYFNSLKSVL